MVLPVILYLHGYYVLEHLELALVTCGPTLRDEQRLGYLRRVLTRICGPKRNETRDWRELHNVYSSTNIIRMIKLSKMRWTGHEASIGTVLVRKPEGKKPVGRPRRR
jgi:hypothetical protein